MKALTCEMCESTDFVKQDGFFVCQQCGVKYTVEEARKMMTDIKEDAPVVKPPAEHPEVVEQPAAIGQPKPDKQTENLLTVARRAHEQGNGERAEEYYRQLLLQIPDSWEAAFFSVYYQCYNTVNAQLGSAAAIMEKSLPATLNLVDRLTDFEEKKSALKTVSQYTIRMGDLLAEASVRFYWDIGPSIRDQYTKQCQDRLIACYRLKMTLGDQIEKKFPHSVFMGYAADAWYSAIQMPDTYSLFLQRNAETVYQYSVKIYPHKPKLVRQYLWDYREGIQEQADNLAQSETNTTRPGMIVAGVALTAFTLYFLWPVCCTLSDGCS